MVIVNLMLRRVGMKRLTDLQHVLLLVLASAGRRVQSDVLLETVQAALPGTTPDALRMCVNRLEDCGVLTKARANRHYAVELAPAVQILPNPVAIRLMMVALAQHLNQANTRAEQAEPGPFAEFGQFVRAAGERAR